VSDSVIVVSNFSAISWREQVNFQCSRPTRWVWFL